MRDDRDQGVTLLVSGRWRRGGVRRLAERVYRWTRRLNAIRYRPVLDLVATWAPTAVLPILEVGSGGSGLAQYSRVTVVGTDIEASVAERPNLLLVRANATALPYTAGRFPMVVAMDVIEHVEARCRAAMIGELLRVSSDRVVLGFPTAGVAEPWERKVRAVFDRVLRRPWMTGDRRHRFIVRHGYLFEHERCSMPGARAVIEELLAAAERSETAIEIRQQENESVVVWYQATLAHMKHSAVRWVLVTPLLILFGRLLSRVGWGGFYRTILIVTKVPRRAA